MPIRNINYFGYNVKNLDIGCFSFDIGMQRNIGTDKSTRFVGTLKTEVETLLGK